MNNTSDASTESTETVPYLEVRVPLLVDFGPRQWLAAVYADRSQQLPEFLARLHNQGCTLGPLDVREMLTHLYAVSAAIGHFVFDFSARPEPWDSTPGFMPNFVLLSMGKRTMQPNEIIKAYNEGDRYLPAATKRCHMCKKVFEVTIAQAYWVVTRNDLVKQERPFIPKNVCKTCNKAHPKFKMGDQLKGKMPRAVVQQPAELSVDSMAAEMLPEPSILVADVGAQDTPLLVTDEAGGVA